ncbi:MAG: HupE/UreJ family protein [Desmonostoc vinosum HA7617-LM4]|nr:HupE/UreJ family protein [Desmonostoc vinosum HA7617-LM4]
MFKMELLESDAAGKFTRFQLQHRHIGAIAALILISLLSSLTGSPADHTILNCWEGLLWGLANPVIGLDCLTVIFAIGLLSAVVVRGAAIARCFFLATLLGMMIHLLQLNLPGVEIAIAISVIAFGRMLISNHLNFVILVLLGVCAGLFQGYVGTKDIVDAETITIVTYILGFSLTQFAVVMSAREIFRTTNISTKKIRLAGFAYCALGVVFLGNLVL